MIYQTLKVAVVAAAMICCSPALAQDCGCSAGGYGGGDIVMYAGGGCDVAAQADNCGRGITQSYAEGLWANYCNDNCGYNGGGGCGLRGRFGGKFGSNSCGCDMGCFGYPTGGGCGTGGFGGRIGGGLFGHGNRGCGGGCQLGAKLKAKFAGRGCGGGCGTDTCGGNAGMYAGAGCGARQSCGGGCFGKKLRNKFSGMFNSSMLFNQGRRNNCGCSPSYFSQPIGFDYGNAGMQSCVSGCGASGYAAPMMAAPQMAPAPRMAPQYDQPVQGSSTRSTLTRERADTNIIGETKPADSTELQGIDVKSGGTNDLPEPGGISPIGDNN